MIRKGKVKAFKGTRRQAVGRQERDRDPRRGPPDRRDDGSVRRARWHSRPSIRPRPASASSSLVDRSGLYKGKPVKALTEGKNTTGGRNNDGRITVRFRGGGHKQAYRMIDFKRRKFDVPATVERIEYDPNRTAFIALIKYQDGELAYILAPQRLAAGRHRRRRRARRREAGQRDAARQHADRHHRAQHRAQDRQGRPDRALGRHLRADRRPRPRLRASCGSNSAEQRLVHGRCMATVGAVSNPDHMNISIGKAGRTRWLGWRGHVRGDRP